MDKASAEERDGVLYDILTLNKVLACSVGEMRHCASQCDKNKIVAH